MLNIPRVAEYARFSSDNQRSESIDAQIRAMNQFCKQNHWQIVATYTDEARSATTDNRPQFQQMITDSSKGMFDIVLVHKLDRFSRDRYDSAIYKKRLKKNNVKLCSVLERMDNSPESIMMESVLEGMAEYYSKNLGREVMKGMNETALQCKHTGGCTPLGYDLDENRHLIINEQEAEAVRIIFEMYNRGCGYSAIISYLNEHNFHPKRGGIFRKNSLLSIIKNEKYAGVFVFNSKAKNKDKIIRVENGCPAIIPKAVYQAAQTRRRKNHFSTGQYHSKEFYLLTGKIFCGICDRRIQGNLRFSGERKNRMATYRCSTLRKLCGNKENNKDYLDAYVVELLRTKIFNKKALKKCIRNLNAYIREFNDNFDKHHEELTAALSTVKESLDRITEAIEKGLLTEALMERAEALEQERYDLQTRLNALRRYDPVNVSDYMPLIEELYNMPRNTKEFRNFVQNYVDKIVTYPFHLEITLDMGFGVTDELKETVTIRRGELYALFESKVKED